MEAEKSTFVEREQRLWEASRDYVRGEISISELHAIEEPYHQTYRTSVLRTARRHWLRNVVKMAKIAILVVAVGMAALSIASLILAIYMIVRYQ